MKTNWEDIKKEIGADLTKKSFSLWINPLTIIEQTDDSIVLGCPNKFSRNWIMENYLDLIREKLLRGSAKEIDVILTVQKTKKEPKPPHAYADPRQLTIPTMPTSSRNGRLRLNRDFTFDRFVVGRSNEFAYSASKALAQGSRWNYNSLLMLSKTGLGKSHLSQAIGNAITRHNPQSRVHYVTAEDFTNEMIFSLKNNCIEDFKNKYRRSCDVLLLEGVHFFSGKEKTQIELGHTLDALANHNKKIIFTSSLVPKEIPRLSKEISSRLSAGLVATIARPDFETRVNILRKKAEEHQITLSGDIIHLLATRLKRDIRQLESALKCLKAKSELMNVKINVDLAKDVMKCLDSDSDSICLEDIREVVCKYYKIDPEMLRSKSRKKIHSFPRNVYICLCRRYTDETVEAIAKSINRSHSTVLYASEVVEKQISKDEKLRSQIDFLSEKLQEIRK
jgi:chromosomal replication initiator protein